MTLFDSDSQQRETATLWRIFSLWSLYGALAAGHVWRWFAINIPMDLGTGGRFTSDIDILARLHDYPKSDNWFDRTWEVKVSLLCKDGSALSLKSGKLARTLTQLKAYRGFGSPHVSLLDVYLCEAGCLFHNPFPPSYLHGTIRTKAEKLDIEGFGYQLLPFEHDKDGDVDVGLITFGGRKAETIDILPARETPPREPFLLLANRINEFFEQAPNRPRKSFNQIVFCRDCRSLQLLCMRDEHKCPNCGREMVIHHDMAEYFLTRSGLKVVRRSP